MRDDGIIPWEWIIDLERTVAVWEYFPTVEAFLNAQLDQFRLNPWEPDLPPLILTEAKGVAAVLERIAYEYCCPISGLKGHAGGHLQLQIAPLLADNASARSFISATSTKVETTSRTILTRCSCKRPDGRSSGCGSDLPKNRSTRKKIEPIWKIDGREKHKQPRQAYECEALGQAGIIDLVRQTLEARLRRGRRGRTLRSVQERERRLIRAGDCKSTR
jgi:hypothetical protein